MLSVLTSVGDGVRVLWMDADALFMDMNGSIEDISPRGGRELSATGDHLSFLNSGMMLFINGTRISMGTCARAHKNVDVHLHVHVHVHGPMCRVHVCTGMHMERPPLPQSLSSTSQQS